MRASGKFTATFLLVASVLLAAGCGGREPIPPDSVERRTMPGLRTGEPAAAAGAPAGAPGQPAAEPSGEDLVALSLVADRAAVVPGQPLVLAARFDIDPEWHIYWLNPGEAGLATEVTFEAPAGFEVGAVRYPGPVRFTSPGPVVSYGYAERVLLSAPVKAPAASALAGRDSVTFRAKAFWLACRESCVRGDGEVELTLPVLPAGREAPPSAEHALVSEHLARLPRPWPAAAHHAWEQAPDGGGWLLVLRLPARLASGANLVFFPSKDDQPDMTGQEQVNDGADVVLRIAYRTAPVPGYARGVLGVEHTFYQLDVPNPSAGDY